MSLRERFARAQDAPMVMRETPTCPHCGARAPFWRRELVCYSCSPRGLDHDLLVRLGSIVAALVAIALFVWVWL